MHVKYLEAIKKVWNEDLPKTIKVFFYLVVSIILSELLIEIGNVQSQGFIIRVLAQIINLVLVFLEETVPEVKKRIKK